MGYLTNFKLGIFALLALSMECTSGGDGGDNLTNEPSSEIYISKGHNGAFNGEQGSDGELWTSINYTKDNLTVTDITVKYEIDDFFGEPMRTALMKWEGSGNIGSFTWAGQLLDGDGNAILHNNKPVFHAYNVGTINGPGEGYGWDISGSPDWAELFVFLNQDTLETSFGIPRQEAINIYKGDFVLGNLVLIQINGEKVK